MFSFNDANDLGVFRCIQGSTFLNFALTNANAHPIINSFFFKKKKEKKKDMILVKDYSPQFDLKPLKKN